MFWLIFHENSHRFPTAMNNRFNYMLTRRSFLMQSIGAFGMTIPQFSRAQSTNAVGSARRSSA